jgi:Domain of unknown function (DUF4265)
MQTHIELAVEGGQGLEPVHAEALGNGRYRIAYSPGLVAGIAAGDEIELLGQDGRFRVVRRGGNIAVQVFSRHAIAILRDDLVTAVRTRLAGSHDGGIERGLVFTIPLSSGFVAIADLFDKFVRAHPGTTWMYGNVYDPRTGLPLNWWGETSAPPEGKLRRAWRRLLRRGPKKGSG